MRRFAFGPGATPVAASTPAVCRRRFLHNPAVLLALLLAACAAASPAGAAPEFRHEPLVHSWAQELGEKLYELSQTVTRAEIIEEKYVEMGAKVEEKDPNKILDQIVERIDGMLQRKAEAVKCIVEKVEVLAEKLNANGTEGQKQQSSGEEGGGEEEGPSGEPKSRGRREGEAGGEAEGAEDEDEEEEDEVVIEFSYHSAKCSQVEILLEEPDANTNGSLYREDNATCENDGIYRPMRLKVDRHFYNIPVNDSHSAVHVPTNVYDQAPRLLKLISMSEGLDEVFVKNYHSDPSLSWQYFGSAAGYLRHFPAMRWKSDPDLFDCRGRPWYVEAASACTKSAVVLVDTTGSMTGMRYSIARLTTGALLETFAPNDLVSVIKFSETPEELVPCFKDTLVPATRENIIAFKHALADAQDHTEGYANFTAAFERAFELFEINRASRGDCSPCGPTDNEVLFLVTDNVPGNWSWLLGQYNNLNSPLAIRRNVSESYSSENVTEEEMMQDEALAGKVVFDADSMSTLPPLTAGNDSEDMLPPVRIVAFLIGKEVFNIKEIEKFTCENRGFSRNLQSLDEVKEEVLEYVPLLAKPLALTTAERDYPRPVVWTHTFADVSDPKISRWLWEVMKNKEQKGRFDAYERNKKMFFNQEEEDHRYVKKRRKEDDESLGYEYQEYRLMTSVSSPAFIRQTVNVSNETEVVAELLGVAGTDVPIDEFLELLHLYEIGVNGYGFAGTTEGNILFHPDLRPVFQGNLKDGFNSVDITEIEILANGEGPRDFPEELLRLRNGMVNQEKGDIFGLDVLMHHDDMRRQTSEIRNYYYSPLPGTPYTVALSLPATYGHYKVEVKGEEEIKRLKKKGQNEYFNDDNWKLHSDWVYCKYLSEAFHLFQSQEERLLHFLEKIQQPNWEWTKSDPLFSVKDPSTHCRHTELAKDVYLCDKNLIELLLFDARLTNTFFRTKEWRLDSEEEKELFHIFNVTLRFMATHSGLTRWQQSPSPHENSTYKYFVDHYKNSIDEYWYKLSVIQHESDPGSYVYTLPYPRGGEGETEDGSELVNQLTVSRAILLGEGNKSAPASVVGYQFPQSSLQSLFEKITSDYLCADGDNSSLCAIRKIILSSMDNSANESMENLLFPPSTVLPSCTSGEVICYIIDGSGYILAASSENNTEYSHTKKKIGKFFGEVEPDVMSELVEVGLYSRHPLFDYQGLCVEEIITSGASFLLMPFYGLRWVFQWAIGQFLWILLKTNLHSLIFPRWAEAAVDAYYDNYDDPGVLVPFGKGDEEEEEVVLKDWRGRSIEKDDDYRPKLITTIVQEACDKWAYRFSLTPPPPPPPVTETPTTVGYNATDLYDSANSTSNYSSTMFSTAPVADALIHQSVWNRWRRSDSSTVPPASTTEQSYNESQSSTTEEYENVTRTSILGGSENETVICSRPFTAERIPHSDLVLVVVSNSESYLNCMEVNKEDDEIDQEEKTSDEETEEYWNPDGSEMHVELKELRYNDTHVCHKLRTGNLPRGKRVNSCITQHPKERLNLLTCRGCDMRTPNILLMVLSSFVMLMNKKWHLIAS